MYMCTSSDVCPLASGNGIYTCALQVMCVHSQVGMVYMYTCSNICPLAHGNGIYTCALVAMCVHSQVGMVMCGNEVYVHSQQVDIWLSLTG